MLDLLIRGGAVLDGTGAPAFPADVGVRGGRIVEIGDLSGRLARRTLAAEGGRVGPGFIDMHSHDDFNLPVNPLASGKTLQGVTTQVTGNCGMSPAPMRPATRDALIESASDLDSGLDYGWESFADFLARMPATGANVAPLVGHGTVRCAVMGDSPAPPTAGQLAEMEGLVAEAMAAGAFGLSTGLFGPPSGHAGTEEIVALARVAARSGGGYHTHMRDEGVRVLEAVDEAVAIGRRAGAAVQISHLKISSPDGWGRTGEILARIDRARAEGVGVAADQYPYVASSGGLRSRLPAWARDGGTEALLARLREPAQRARLRHDLLGGMAEARVSLRIYRWDLVRVASSPGRPEYAGLTLAEIGEREAKPPVDAFLDLLAADRGATVGIFFHIDEGDLRAIMRHPRVAVGSDGLFTGRPGRADATRPHPRHFGTFPRVLGRYARDLGVLDLPEAVRRMTSLPADVLGLRDRGRVRVGHVADLVLFDPARVADRATFEEPRLPPVGVLAVVVAGVPVALEGEPTGATPGRVLRRGAS